MEKLKPFLTTFKKHHFWFAAVAAIAVVLYAWNVGVGQLKQQFDTNAQKVKLEFQNLQNLRRRTEFPNPEWKTATNDRAQMVADKVKTASSRVMRAQQQVLQWPDQLGTDFSDLARDTPPDKWPQEALEAYRELIPESVEQLRDVMGAAAGPHQEGTQWNDENYQLILNAYTWPDPKQGPTIAIYQKALWCYQTLAKIIAATNQEAPDRFNLPLHTVQELAVNLGANFEPADWNVGGIEPVSGNVLAMNQSLVEDQKNGGYESFPVRLRIRIEEKALPNFLTACANADLPLDVLGMRVETPSRLIVIEPPKKKKSPSRFGVRFGRPVAPEPETDKEPEVKKPALGRGSLVEIWGLIYIAKDTDFGALLAAQEEAEGV